MTVLFHTSGCVDQKSCGTQSMSTMGSRTLPASSKARASECRHRRLTTRLTRPTSGVDTVVRSIRTPTVMGLAADAYAVMSTWTIRDSSPDANNLGDSSGSAPGLLSLRLPVGPPVPDEDTGSGTAQNGLDAAVWTA